MGQELSLLIFFGGGAQKRQGQDQKHLKKSLGPWSSEQAPAGSLPTRASRSCVLRRLLHNCSSCSCTKILSQRSELRGPWMEQPVGAGEGRFNLQAGFSTSHTGGVVLMPYHRAYILACPNVKCTQQGFEMCILWAQGSLEATECRDSIIRPEISWSCRKWHRCQKCQCAGSGE